jgi:hypothetical protein
VTGAELQEAWELSRPAQTEVDAWVQLLRWCCEDHQIAIPGAQRHRRATQTSPGQRSDTPTILSPQIASQPETES